MSKLDWEQIVDSCLKDSGTVEDAIKLGFFKEVREPDYSFSVLSRLQSQHQVSTFDVLKGLVVLQPDVVSEWLYNYRIFIRAGGDPGELLKIPFRVDTQVDKTSGAGANPAPDSFKGPLTSSYSV